MKLILVILFSGFLSQIAFADILAAAHQGQNEQWVVGGSLTNQAAQSVLIKYTLESEVLTDAFKTQFSYHDGLFQFGEDVKLEVYTISGTKIFTSNEFKSSLSIHEIGSAPQKLILKFTTKTGRVYSQTWSRQF